MAPSAKDRETITVDGHQLTLTNLSKVMYPAVGTTKRDVIDYYRSVAETMLPYIADRPITRKRWVNGTGEPPFFQKNLDASTPSWVTRRTIEHKDHQADYPLADSPATVVWLAQIGSLEIHVPQWRFDENGERANPDRMVLDLDPGPGAGLAECVQVAHWVKDILAGMDLEPMPVTSGSKGLHLYAALDGSSTSAEVNAVAHELARAVAADHPDLVVSEQKKTLRDGRVLIDWSQNNQGKTTVAPYSLRGREQPWVAAPRTWAELDDPHIRQLLAADVVARVRAGNDPLASLLGGRHRAPRRGHRGGRRRTEAIAGSSADDGGPLAPYRAKRVADATPEPMPAGPSAALEPTRTDPGASTDPTFVIQEHHARRLHWDFRLARDGVLVSWALPKGVPTEGGRNHLAVHVEDHPLEYATFEGTIPAGHYGAGTVTLWDSGRYETHKWRHDEVIVTLDSDRGRGRRTYALIRTAAPSDDAAAEHWLIHLMAQPPRQRRPGGQPEPDGAQAARPEPDGAGCGAQAARPEPDGAGSGPQARGAQRPGPSSLAGERPVPDPAIRQGPPPEPMLATLARTPAQAAGPDWAYEMKWDGIRAIATVNDGAVRLWSRNGMDMTMTYPELGLIADVVDSPAILDGEIVAFDSGGRPDFGLLQQRMNARGRELQGLSARIPVDYLVFDILATSTGPVIDRSYEERRTLLRAVVHPAGRLHIPDAFENDLASALATSRALGLEGVLAKRRTSHYLPGARSRDWLKLKHQQSVEVVVVGWRPSTTEQGLASVLVAVPDADGDLRYAGRVGTGFSTRSRGQIERELMKTARKTAPIDVPAEIAADARWTRPRRVAEVTFAGWTAGGHLRHPVWRGWRPDKGVGDLERDA